MNALLDAVGDLRDIAGPALATLVVAVLGYAVARSVRALAARTRLRRRSRLPFALGVAPLVLVGGLVVLGSAGVAASPPSAPQNVSASPQVGSILVSWQPPASGEPLTDYKLAATPTDNSPPTAITASPDAVSASITGLSASKSYEVAILAENSAGPGPEVQVGPIKPLPNGGGGAGGNTPAPSGSAAASVSASAGATPTLGTLAPTPTAAPTPPPSPVPPPTPAQSPPGDPKNFDLGPAPVDCPNGILPDFDNPPFTFPVPSPPGGWLGTVSPACLVRRDPGSSLTIGGHFFQVGDTIVAAVTGSPNKYTVDGWTWGAPWPGTKIVSGCHKNESECILKAVKQTGGPGRRYEVVGLHGGTSIPSGGCCGGPWIATDYYGIIDLTNSNETVANPPANPNPWGPLVASGFLGTLGGALGGTAAATAGSQNGSLRDRMRRWRKANPGVPWSVFFATEGVTDPNAKVQDPTVALFFQSLKQEFSFVDAQGNLKVPDVAQRGLFMLVGLGNALINAGGGIANILNTDPLYEGANLLDYLLNTPIDQIENDMMTKFDATTRNALAAIQQGLQQYVQAAQSGDYNQASQITGGVLGNVEMMVPGVYDAVAGQMALASSAADTASAVDVADAAGVGGAPATTTSAADVTGGAPASPAAPATDAIPPGAPEPSQPLAPVEPPPLGPPPPPPALTADQFAQIQSSAVPLPDGVSFLDPSDPAAGGLSGLPPAPDGAFTAVVHGYQYTVVADGVPMSASDFATLLRDSGWQPGQPVRLVSCWTGAYPDGFAQALANELGVPVTAPTTTAYIFGGGTQPVSVLTVAQKLPGGGVIVPPTIQGSWITFTPQ